MSHDSGIVYDREVRKTMSWLSLLTHFTPAWLVVTFKSSLPRTYLRGDTQVQDSSGLEKRLLQGISKGIEYNKNAGSNRRVFVMPLEEAAFKKHVEGLELYWWPRYLSFARTQPYS